MRTILYDLLLFLLPFAVFFAYALWANRRRANKGIDPLKTPWFWLAVIGLLLAIASFFWLGAVIEPHTGRYIPAVTNPDGTVTPGHYEEDGAPPRVPPPQSPPPAPKAP